MSYWIKRGSSLFGLTAFFVVLACLLVKPGAIEYPMVLTSCTIAFGAALLCWFFGAVVCDIIIKSLIVDIGPLTPEQLVEGGILQQLHTMREQYVPGGKEIPFVNSPPQTAADGKGKKT